MISFWNRLIRMDDDRLSRKILLWDIAQNKKCWAYEISQILKNANFVNANLEIVPESSVWANIHEKKCNEWQNNIYHLPKLRTYVLFKGNFCMEPYVRVNMNRKYRSVLAKLIIGLVSSVRRALASKLRGPGFKSRPGTVGSPATIIMWGARPAWKLALS